MVYSGKSQSKMDDLGVLHFRKLPYMELQILRPRKLNRFKLKLTKHVGPLPFSYPTCESLEDWPPGSTRAYFTNVLGSL